VVQRGLPFSRAVSTYTILTVGEGLVSQIPALVISTAAGIMVTNASGGSRMGAALANQLGSQPRAMWITAAVLACFGLIPGLPSLPFLALGAGTAMLARSASRNEQARMDRAEADVQAAAERPAEAESPMRDLLQIDPIELEVGYALISLVDEAEGGDLLQRISLLRKQAALELGILVPPVRIRDDIRLPASEYVIKLRGAEIARAEVMPRFLLALDTGGVIQAVEGIETVDPSFGMPARWITAPRRMEAESFGYVVVEPPTVVATHLMEMLKSNAGELLGRQDVQEMVETLRKSHPALVEDVVPGKISLGVLHRVLQRLLRERVPIRDLVTILEALGDAAEQTKDPEALTEHARRALSHVIARMHLDESGGIRAVTIGPRLEAALMGLFSPRIGQQATGLLDPDTLAGLLRELGRLANVHSTEGRPAPLVTPPALRVGIRRLIEPVLPNVPVLSLAELPPQINLDTIAHWEMKDA
jgi:flagellar biosynthesis protein FlhA